MASHQFDLLRDLASDGERWWTRLPGLMDIQRKWITASDNSVRGVLPVELHPFIRMNAVYLLGMGAQGIRVGEGFYAALTFRSLIERICLLWTSVSTNPLVASDLLNDLEGANQKARRAATQRMLDEACKADTDMQVFYLDILSRYFSHVSHFDLVQKQHGQTMSASPLEPRLRVVPVLLWLDASERLCRFMEALLADHSLPANPRMGGREDAQYHIGQYVRVACHAFCEKHSQSHSIGLRMLLNGVRDVEGSIGLNEVYRGGMVVSRHGDPIKKPDPALIAECALFAIGRHDPSKVKVKLVAEGKAGERYELSWPKDLEVGYVLVAFAALNSSPLLMFDYVTEFHDLLVR